MFSQAQPIEWVSWAREVQRTYCQGQPYIYNSRVIVVYACVCILNAYVKLSQLNCLKWMKASWTREKNATQTKNHWRKKKSSKIVQKSIRKLHIRVVFSNVKSFVGKRKLEQKQHEIVWIVIVKQSERIRYSGFSAVWHMSVYYVRMCVYFGCVKYDISFIEIAHYNSGPNLILILFREIEKPFEANE